MAQNKHRDYRDVECISDLEAFVDDAAGKPRI
jgi:hypothetical protein